MAKLNAARKDVMQQNPFPAHSIAQTVEAKPLGLHGVNEGSLMGRHDRLSVITRKTREGVCATDTLLAPARAVRVRTHGDEEAIRDHQRQGSMVGRLKTSFIKAHGLLTALRENVTDVDTLRRIQQLLLREITLVERQIRRTKSKLKAVQRVQTSRAASRASLLEERISMLQQRAHIWRCFGDGIAFLYMDKFALKHCYYNTGNTNPKQGAGFLIDKTGLLHEIAILEAALEHEVPALLVDLTNTIRHGDVCLMGNNDPFLLEVKSSGKLDRRGRRQREAIEKIHSFFATDAASGLRGFANIRRVAFAIPETNYIADLEKCIAGSLRDGYGVSKPENGLTYLALMTKGPRLEEAMALLDLQAPWVFSLNEAKVQQAWAPYVPFVLSLADRDHLWRFIRGSLYLMVFVERDALLQHAKSCGYDAQFDPNDENFTLRFNFDGAEGTAGVSSHLLARIAYEFVSPKWVVEMSIEQIKREWLGVPRDIET